MGLRDIAELLVIDEFVNRWFLPADRAIRILPEVQRSNFHGKGVKAKEFSHKILALPQDELDGLEGLYGSDETGQYTKNPGLGTAWSHSRRRWFGIEATIAGTLTRVED